MWNEFNESLVEVRDRNKLYNTADAAYFFNNHSLAGGLTENRLFSAVPGFLTAFGVLGTFLGLTFGLKGIDFTGDDTTQITSGINAMVNGASTAFITSLWGVLTSLLFNWVEKVVERKVKARIQNLQAKIDSIFPRIVAEQTLTEIRAVNEEAKLHLATLDEKIGDKLQTVMNNTAETISASIVETLANSLTPALDKLMDNSCEGSEKVMETLIQEFLNKIGNAGETQKLAMNNATQALSESSTQMMTHLSRFVEQIDTKVTEVRDGNREMLEKMHQYFNTQVSDMQAQTQQQNQQAVEFMQELATSMQEFNAQNQALLSSMGNMLSDKVAEQSATFAKREQDLTASADHFMEKLAKAIEDLNRNNTEMLKLMENSLTARMNAQADADEVRAKNLIQQTEKGREAQNALTESVKDVLLTQRKQNDDLSSQLTTLSQSFERIAQANKQSSEAISNASNKMNNSATGFDSVATRLQTALSQFDAKLLVITQKFEKVAQENNQMATLFNTASNRLDNAGSSLGQTVEYLGSTVNVTKQTFEAMQQNFNQFTSELKRHIGDLNVQVSDLLLDYSKQVQEQTNHRLNEWNMQTQEYTSNMVNAVKALSDTVDEIETKLPRNR